MQLGKFKPPSFEIGTNVKYEKLVSNNIKHIKADMLYIEHNVGDLSNKFASKKLLETIRSKLENVHALISVTDGYLAEWEIQIQQSPSFQMDDDSFERLSGQFKRETAKVGRLSELVKQKSIYSDSISTDDGSSVDLMSSVDTHFINEAKLDFEYDEQLVPLFTIGEKELLLSDSIVQTRNEGIMNIKGQIEQARDIFKDLATIVTVQDQGFQEIENNLIDSKLNSMETLTEIEQYKMNRKSNKKRTMWLIGIISCLGSGIFYGYRYIYPLLI
ncbi:syntaxin [Theileria orientalis]|uniref:Syntaxin n=1 Tax=Theileria orientalis TaxID=68886 RepID=A0A976QWY7_THEOR|nr:syntaxin [Theileria orientalis]